MAQADEYDRCRQDDPLICCDLWYPGGPQSDRRGIFLAILRLLLWMAHLGYSFESYHAAMPTSLVPQLQHLHVSLVSLTLGGGPVTHVPGGALFSCLKLLSRTLLV